MRKKNILHIDHSQHRFFGNIDPSLTDTMLSGDLISRLMHNPDM